MTANSIITLLNEHLKQIYNDYIQNNFSSRGVNKQKLMNESFVKILKLVYPELYFQTEIQVESQNYNNAKRCDIVGYSNNILTHIFPIKFIMSSYLKNRNNYYENLIGESYCLKQSNKEVNIIPINILLYKIPNMDSNKKIISETIITEKQFNQQVQLYEMNELFDNSLLVIYDNQMEEVKYHNIQKLIENNQQKQYPYLIESSKYEIFTPPEIVDLMIKQHKQFQTSDLNCLEPSCGKGNIIYQCQNQFQYVYGYDINQNYIEEIQNKQSNVNDKQIQNKVQLFHMDFLKSKHEMLYDNIIMNPPYVKIQNIKPVYRDFLKKEFKLRGSYDVYHAFIIKSLSILSENGIITMIIPNTFLTNKNTQWIKNQLQILSITNFKEQQQIFKNVDVYPCIITCQKQKTNQLTQNNQLIQTQQTTIHKKCFGGIATLNDKIFIHSEKLFDEPCWKQILKVSKSEKMFCIYPYDDDQNIQSEQQFQQNNPQTYQYLLKFKPDLDKQPNQKSIWYSYGRSQNLKPQKGIFISSLISRENIKITESQDPILYFNGIFINTTLTKEQCLQIINDNFDKISQESSQRKNGWYNLSVSKLDKYFQ